MSKFKNMDTLVKKLSFLDLKLIKATTAFGVLIIVKLIPQILSINIWWFVALFLVCMIKPVCTLFIQE